MPQRVPPIHRALAGYLPNGTPHQRSAASCCSLPNIRLEVRSMTVRGRVLRNAGGVVAATWLIGLGVVFLLQQMLDLAWGEAWPMFVILAGIGSLVSLLVGIGYRRHWFTQLAWPILLIVAGSLLLASTTRNLGIEPAELIGRWWPVAVIALGAWFLIGAVLPGSRVGNDTLQLPLDADSARVKVSFGGGELSIGTGRSGLLIDGSFEGMPAKVDLRGPGSVALQPESPASWPWFERTPHWRIGLPPDVPLELQIESGATKTRLELGDLQLRSLKIGTGASDTRVALPRAAGETHVRAESGAASMTFEVPDGVAARIRSTMALGSSRIDETRFPRSGRGWETPGYDAAPNRVELDISGGVGSVAVRGG
jgi:hypothetical protein